MLDPASITLYIGAMKAAFKGIQYCCDALNEGKVEIQRIKKTVEQGVGDAKAIYKEVTGILGWLKTLFGVQSPPDIPSEQASKPAPAAAPAKAKVKEKYEEHIPDDDEIVQQFVGHLGQFFRNHKLLSEYTTRRYEEVYAMDDPDPIDILELTTLQDRLDAAYMQLSELMRVRAPKQLGPLWEKFNAMHSKVLAAQKARREKERINRLKTQAHLARLRDERIARQWTWFWSVLGIGFFWCFMWIVWETRRLSQ